MNATDELLRPEWLFELAQRFQAFALSPQSAGFSDDSLQPHSALETRLLLLLCERRDLARKEYEARVQRQTTSTVDPVLPTRITEAVATAQRLLAADCASPWPVERLARRVGCNRTDLELGFRQLLFQTVHSYLTDRRVNLAKVLLRSTAWRVEEVGRGAGFRSKASLYRHFHRVLHMTPDEYRRRWSLAPPSASVTEHLLHT